MALLSDGVLKAGGEGGLGAPFGKVFVVRVLVRRGESRRMSFFAYFIGVHDPCVSAWVLLQILGAAAGERCV